MSVPWRSTPAKYLSTPDNGDFEFGADTDFSVAFWFQSTGWSGKTALISNKDWSSDGNKGWVIGGSDSNKELKWNYKGADGSKVVFENQGAVIGNNTWHHIAVVHDRDGEATFYLDGAKIGATDISASGGSIGYEFQNSHRRRRKTPRPVMGMPPTTTSASTVASSTPPRSKPSPRRTERSFTGVIAPSPKAGASSERPGFFFGVAHDAISDAQVRLGAARAKESARV